MYAFIVQETWSKYGSNDYAGFLRAVGTPSLLMNPKESNTFNDVSGFYVKIEEGWAVRYKSTLVTNDALAGSMGSMSII